MPYISGVNLLPGTGEFTYDTVAYRGARVTEPAITGVNLYNANGAGIVTDFSVAIDQLEAAHPDCETVSLVVTWFGDTTSAGTCRIYPSTTYIGGAFQVWNGAAYVTDYWRCSGLSQFSAGLIPLSQTNGRFNYGGTPSDQSVVRAIQNLKARGFRVVFYPFILMDIAGSFPWRGRITHSPDKTAAAATAVATFLGSAVPANFTQDAVNLTVNYLGGGSTDWTFRRMILHYANLCVIAGGVDLFVIGSELRGLETIRGPAWTKAGVTGGDGKVTWDYPFVEGLKTLADDVRGIFDAAGLTKNLTTRKNLISYAADWSSWMGWQHPGEDGQWPHLDQLYGHSSIDLVCFDNYLPLSDWTTNATGQLDVIHWSDPKPSGAWPPSAATMNGLGLTGTPTLHSKAYLKANIEGGEKFHWYYDDGANLGRGLDPTGTGLQISRPQTDRLDQSRKAFAANQELLANKQLRWWWNNPHKAIYDTGAGWVPQGNPTKWVAQAKPVAFTEYGFATVNRATNQPNVFYDPKSSESFTPYWSTWNPSTGGTYTPVSDDQLAELALRAVYEYWFADTPSRNEASGGGVVMLEQAFCSVWNWDARPFPAFPALTNVWGDAQNWRAGLSLPGKRSFAELLPSASVITYPLPWPIDSRGRPIRAAQTDLHLESLSRSGGQSVTGQEQIVASPAGRWVGRMILPAMDAVTLRNWRAFVAKMRGRYGSALIPVCEADRRPFPLGGPAITVTAAAAPINATSLVLTVTTGSAIIEGHLFSIAGRLYNVMQSIPAGGGVYNVDISPWLRAAISAGTACEFTNPTCLMRFATDAEGKLDLMAGIIAHPEINLVEAF